MSNKFEWKTEEEADWEEEMVMPDTRPSRSIPWKLLGLLLLGTLVLVGGVRWQLNQQVRTVTRSVEQDVQAAHLFLQRVAAQRDVDLFKSLLSGRDPEWVEAQKTLVVQGWFGNSPLWGGTAVPLTATDPLTITLSPDLFSAEVQSETSYHVLNTAGITETVTLQQTAVYRRGDDRWLYAPPEDLFWGETAVYRGDAIIVRYPERDEEIVTRLAEDLDALVATICAEITPCNDPLPKRIVFNKEASSLVQRANLPTPSLIGLPVDEAGYQALYRAYAVPIATEVIAQQVDYEYNRWQLMFQSLLDRQLYQLGLRPWSLDTAVYDQLARQPAVGGLARLLTDHPSYTPLEQKRLYAFVEFLEPLLAEDVTLADMQRELDKPRGITAWVNEFADTPFDDDSVERAFYHHILQHTTAAQPSPPPIPLPDAHIQLVCNPESTNGRVALYEYDLAATSWHEQYYKDNLPFWTYFQPILADPNLILMFEMSDPQGMDVTYTLLENGESLASFTLDEGLNNFYGWGSDPYGRYLLLGRWYDGPPEFRLLDVEACRAGDCLPEPVAGLMVWSPDGQHTLITPAAELDQPSATIWLGDAVGENRQLVGAGKQPFWIDEQTYGYVQINGAAQEEWVTAVIGENSPRVLLSAERVLNAIPQEQRPTIIYMNSPFTFTAGSDQLGMMAYSSRDSEPSYYVFIVTLEPGQGQVKSLTLLHQDNRKGWVELSPDGRWLMTFADGEFGSTQVTLHSREDDIVYSPLSSSNPYSLSWSSDGKWTVHTGDGYLFLSAPDVQYEQIIFHDFGECTGAYWKDTSPAIADHHE